MKQFLFILFLLYRIDAGATTYYFSASGNDANAGTSPSSAWKTISKFNSVFASKSAGDILLFNRGDIFYGTLIISRSGTPTAPITIGAYGAGAMPVITGFTSVSSWTNLGSNIWESSSAASTLPYTNMVVVNGVNTPMGRYPNSGYFHYQSHSGITSITSSDLAGSLNWTGAELALNITTARIARNTITSQSGSTLLFTADPEGAGFQSDNQRFIIQNDPRTLDTANEWYYNPATKKLRIYSAGMPAAVQVATLDSLAYINGHSYITFDNISFQGANTAGIEINNSPFITIQNCDFNFCGRNAIFGKNAGSSLNVSIVNCSINHTNDNAIDLPRVTFDNPVVKLCTIKNAGVIYGMMDRNDGINNNSTAQAISASGANTLIDHNTIDSVGFIGVHFFGNNTIIQNNYIADYCMVLNDGGAIYSWNGSRRTVQSGIKILNNVTVNRNTLSAINTADYGVYLDDLSNNIEVTGNTCASSGWGIELHNVFDVKVTGNTFYNNSMAPIILYSDNAAGVVTGKTNMSNIVIKGNIFFAKTSTQKTFWIYAKITPLLPPGLISDSNYYARPADKNGPSILTNFNNQSGQVKDHTLGDWQSFAAVDMHSNSGPAISDASAVRFEYNAAAVSKVVALDGNYIDVKNASYNGTITLAPYSSAILIRNGAATNRSPLANAGPDQTITLPVK